MNRLNKTFARLAASGRSAFVSFITAGDPTRAVSEEILHGLPAAGVDIIELGMPFSDPSADGPTIDKASQRALAAGANMRQTLDMVRVFRETNDTVPIVLMGYYNPLLAYGLTAFAADAVRAGVDGLLIVDLPPEEDSELRDIAVPAGLDLIRLAAPTTKEGRIERVLSGASGFIYYVAVAGVTGQKSADVNDIEAALKPIKAATDLPLVVGFGIKTVEDVRAFAGVADGVVVGSAIVAQIEARLDESGRAPDTLAADVLEFVQGLTAGVRSH